MIYTIAFVLALVVGIPVGIFIYNELRKYLKGK